MKIQLINVLRDDLIRLKEGKGCWSVAAGSGTGSMATLNFGERIKRCRPIKNPMISVDSQNFEGEYCLYLENCDWRLQTSAKVIASSASSNHEGGVMVTAFNQIVGRKVIDIALDITSFDIIIEFENGIRLTTFCLGASDEELDNYTFFTPRAIYTAKFSGVLVRDFRRNVNLPSRRQ